LTEADTPIIQFRHLYIMLNYRKNSTVVQNDVKVKVKVAFISIIINDKNKLDTVITKN